MIPRVNFAKLPVACFALLGSLSLVACGGGDSDGEPDESSDTGGSSSTGGSPSGGSSTGGSSSGGSSTGGSSSGGSSTGGSAGSGGTASPELTMLCADIVELHVDKTAELSCSSDDSAPLGRMCAISGSCITELTAHYNCERGATTWSCDTGDGHPQTNGACNTTNETFFACLAVAVHEEDPFGCASIAEMKNGFADTLGCSSDTTGESTCNQLYLRDLCLTEWEALLACTEGTTADDYECAADDSVTPKPTTCPTEKAAFDACLAG